MSNINTLTDGELSNTDEFKAFFDSYLETALWSSTDVVEGEDVNLDDVCGLDDISGATLSDSIDDCLDFYRAAVEATESFQITTLDGYNLNPSQYGHDFWLTRCGHGAGFWDGDYPENLGNTLTDLSKPYGDVYLYIGDDGLIYN